jgi:hypothetical protein
LLILTGLAALVLLRMLGCDWFETSVGAACYQLSALTVLKAGQYHLSFAIFIIIPLALALVHAARRARATLVFVGLVTALSSMLLFMFLQPVVYGVLLIGAYALWRAFVRRRWSPVVITFAAIIVSIVISSPRLLSVALEMKQYTREIAGIDFSDFNANYDFQNIRPYEILRWFDDTIFGISPSDAEHLGNNINLMEGFLLSTSAATALDRLAAIQGAGHGVLVVRAGDLRIGCGLEAAEPCALRVVSACRPHARENPRCSADADVCPARDRARPFESPFEQPRLCHRRNRGSGDRCRDRNVAEAISQHDPARKSASFPRDAEADRHAR